jgi:stage II sporulation protein B
MNKARITYRLDPNRGRGEGGGADGQEEKGRVIPLYQEEYRVVDEQQEPAPDNRQRGPMRRDQEIRDYQGLNQYTSDYGAWNSPFDAETNRIEELIRDSNEREGRRPMGAEPEPVERNSRYLKPEYEDREYEELDRRDIRYNGQTGHFQPGPPIYRDDRDDRYEGPVVMGPRYVRHNRPPWLKISVSIAGAAVTGVLLGFFALSIFNGSDPVDAITGLGGKSDTPAAQDAKPVSANVQGTDTKTAAGTGAAVVSGKEVSLSYAGKTYSFLQHGSFANQQGADQTKNDLVKKGLAAASEQSDKYYVFAGVATDKESAMALSQQLKNANKVDIYVKAYTVPAVSKAVWNGSPESLKSYLDQSDKLLQSINLLTVMNLDGLQPSPIEASTMQSLAAAHTAWSQVSNTVAQEAGETGRAVVQRMNNAMNSAKVSLDEYKKNPSTAMLWQAQTYMMQFIIAEKELLTQIQK